jgi:hypothetical protein
VSTSCPKWFTFKVILVITSYCVTLLYELVYISIVLASSFLIVIILLLSKQHARTRSRNKFLYCL